MLVSIDVACHNKKMNPISKKILVVSIGSLVLFTGTMISVFAQKTKTSTELDARVERFLDENRTKWHDWNVPYQDGKLLHNLVIKNNYKKGIGNRHLYRPFHYMDCLGTEQNGR
jgi:hypothetical protein